ncbi:F-box protein CPR30-like [Pyrus ussuriensis x Pyrus communis]|uniref:F-box protein CPR30-like n=1 Tax=Pyrus ussuriensis x Pyrus communis TaxID=2448454 RepID=A0A5N5GMN1_9ROSA|nr:F-box protein CPR30-like [Pyrus ussuriensis x Pyrus communis]KAB2616826.1 F-box protein CPR30-like [Pyrus ussuriensis x Pyrus communis]
MIHKFPEEIIHDILFRLPSKTLIRCTSVCKPWNSMIKNPSFIRTHLNRTINLNNQFGTHLRLLHCVPGARCSSDVNISVDEPREEQFYLHYDNHAFDEYCKLEFPIFPREEMHNKFLRVVGICNGLVFLADDKDCLGYTFMLCNPSMRKSVTVPKPHLTFNTIGPYYACIGFGFDAATNDYKVVRLITDQCVDPNTFYEVYSLAGGSWSEPRSLDHVCEVKDPRKPQAFVNGAIHWEACRRLKNGDYEDFILAYDLGSDSFRGIMAPKSFHSSWTSQLSVSGDGKSIALFQPYLTNTKKRCVDIWVMKEYGKEESWTKLTTLSRSGPQRGVRYRPLCFTKCGDVVLVPIYGFWECELLCLDLMSKQFKKLGIHGYIYYYAESYVESLVLLDKTNAVSY